MQIKIFDKVPLRREVSVRLDRPVNRSEGIGASPLHIDFVNAAFPPEFVCLYCIRPDPLDGGTSVIAPLRESLDSIDARHLQPLSDAVFRDGTVVDLSNVGRDSNPFAVFSPHGRWVYRFTSNLLLDPVSPEHNDALMNLREALVAHQQTIQLHEGDALLMDQRRVVHGKNELGIGQDTLPGIKRRLLRQGFFREISSFTNS
jgi:hypothetical protein